MSAPARFPRPNTGAVADAAADWLSRRERGLTAAERRAFAEWQSADPRRARAVAELEATWSLLQKPRRSGQAQQVLATLAQIEARRTARRRRATAFSAATLAAAAAVMFALWPGRARPARETPAPAVAKSVVPKPQRQALPDGSVVELNAGAEIAVDYSPGRRGVQLVRGSAHFAVAKDAARPFVVTAGAVAVRAVGTEFAVELAERAVEVLVTEGRVAVEPIAATQASPATQPAPLFVQAGTGVTVPLATAALSTVAAQPVTPAQMQHALAWRTLRVEFTAMPLAEVLALFNRRNELQLALADPALGALQISGVFWSNDPEGFARLLQASAGLAVTHRDAGRLTLGRE